MIIKKQRYDLVSIIFHDLIAYGKLQLFLLFLILISAMSIVIVTYHTRNMLVYREQLLLETDSLNIEWRNLMFQEKILSNHDRIEHIAIDKLHMCYTDLKPENIFN